MNTISSSYTIKRVLKTTDSNYIESLSIYNQTTPISIKTSINEITFWLKNSKKKNSFELFVFSLCANDMIIGFAMVSYIPSKKTVIFDYISLSENHRTNVVFLTYINMIQSFFYINKYEVSYFIVEISNKENGLEIDSESAFWQRLIYIENFGKINGIYKTPPLNSKNFESVFDAFIFLKTIDQVDHITNETYISLIDAIYQDYYLSWYKPFMNENEYENYISKLHGFKNDIIKKIEKIENFSISYIELPTIKNLMKQATISIPIKTGMKKSIIVFLSLLVIFFPILIILFYNFLLDKIGIPLTSVNTMIGSLTAALLTILATYLISKKKS